MTSTAKYKTSAPNKPKNCWDLFCSFTLMAMQAFGGSTAIAQQFLVDQKKWFTQSEFLDLLTVSQVLPGPNIMILTIMVGDRHFGWRGALASFLGMITLPATLMLSVFVFYQQYAENKWVSDALVGMAASASGMVAGAAMKLLYNCKENIITPPVWIFGLVITFITVGVLKISMVYILPIVGIPLSFWAWYQFIKERSAQS